MPKSKGQRGEFLHRGLKDSWGVFLQPGQGCRIHFSDGNKGDLPVCCHTSDGAFIRLILSGISAGIEPARKDRKSLTAITITFM